MMIPWIVVDFDWALSEFRDSSIFLRDSVAFLTDLLWFYFNEEDDTKDTYFILSKIFKIMFSIHWNLRQPIAGNDFFFVRVKQ